MPPAVHPLIPEFFRRLGKVEKLSSCPSQSTRIALFFSYFWGDDLEFCESGAVARFERFILGQTFSFNIFFIHQSHWKG